MFRANETFPMLFFWFVFYGFRVASHCYQLAPLRNEDV